MLTFKGLCRLYLFTALVGLANAVQAGVNSSLSKARDNKFAAALCIVAVSASTVLVMGHYGLVGFKEHAAGWERIAGAGLMFAGLALIAKF